MSRRRKRTSKSAGSARERPSDAAVVRIIGGELRGRRIEYDADPRTRPMKDRVREAIFNLLGDVTGMAAIDLFAGTGALGFEALSRGAAAAVFFEQHFPTADLIRGNALAFGVADRCEVIAADTFIHFRRAPVLPERLGDLRWLVFCSPPYDFYVSRQDETVCLLAQLWQVAPMDSAFIAEADERFDFSFLPEPLDWDLRSYPPARIGVVWKTK